jgi:YesN/AraC family two-component response regulator
MKHSIAIVDDHILIAKALSGIIENFADFEVLYECENGKALQEKFSNKKDVPDIVLLDISMPVMVKGIPSRSIDHGIKYAG